MFQDAQGSRPNRHYRCSCRHHQPYASGVHHTRVPIAFSTIMKCFHVYFEFDVLFPYFSCPSCFVCRFGGTFGAPAQAAVPAPAFSSIPEHAAVTQYGHHIVADGAHVAPQDPGPVNVWSDAAGEMVVEPPAQPVQDWSTAVRSYVVFVINID